jgi:hypothetical protein
VYPSEIIQFMAYSIESALMLRAAARVGRVILNPPLGSDHGNGALGKTRPTYVQLRHFLKRTKFKMAHFQFGVSFWG